MPINGYNNFISKCMYASIPKKLWEWELFGFFIYFNDLRGEL